MEDSRFLNTSMDEDGATTVDTRSGVVSGHRLSRQQQQQQQHDRRDSMLSHCSTLSGLSSVFSSSGDALASPSHSRQPSSSSFTTTAAAGAATNGASSAATTATATATAIATITASSPTKWSIHTPPGTPSRTKLRAEYQARLSSSPLKRRMHSSPGAVGGGGNSYSPFASPSSASKRGAISPSASSLRRAASDGGGGAGGEYGDRFVPARRSAQMEIAYSLLQDGDDENDAFLKECASPFGSRRGGLFSDLASPSSSSLGRLAALQVASGAVVASSATGVGADGTGVGSPNGSMAVVAAAAVTAAASSANVGAPTGAGGEAGGQEGQAILNMLLANELLGMGNHHPRPSGAAATLAASYARDAATQAGPAGNIEGAATVAGEMRAAAVARVGASSATGPATPPRRPLGASGSRTAPALLAFKSPREKHTEEAARHLSFSPGGGGLLPVGDGSRRLLATPRKAKRKISKVPFKVLDAPGIQDDFYLQMVDWSALNVLAVGLGSCVYLWSACTSKVTKLCDLGQDDCVTSVGWTQRGTHLAVGTNQGEVQIWDASKCRKVRTMAGHSARIGTLSWNAQTLASGSRDRCIHLHDVRAREPFTARLQAHRQEVCGLRWSFDDAQLASGGNDNKLFVWSLAAHGHGPVQRFTDHTAAVKAIAWSPHQNGLLASGGGTADRCIRFWNTLTGAAVAAVDTGSQVCNLMWSRTVNEIVSTHGYSLNQIILWRYPTMAKVATLTGHTYRVLYLAMSPDGQTIVTGAGDETLRFWSAFPGSAKTSDGSRLAGGSSLLFPSGHDIR